MSIPIDERVEVLVRFDSTSSVGKIFPVAMTWKDRTIQFKDLIFTSAHRVGEKRFLSLVCQSDSANFELEFDSESYCWWLRKVVAQE
jgi:hypothetical protein